MNLWVRLARMTPSPSMLNFLAGLLAGTGINLLTSSAVDDKGLGDLVVVDSVAWVAAAAALTGMATLLQNAERDAVPIREPDEDERRELQQIMVERVARRVVALAAAAVVALGVAVALLPHLGG
ncbi:hypothetical protein BJY16_005945 [Actinoplanes octamycinicus]|uniref:Uncharacterized protein n=1 Tax=Actinoplanes octamycinicus TaxID=135948 RepID=A0A7W7MA27_9ACTN|nr:hypothetical protein [Actinoplanes octamycinicus]MBB4742486.1 hypothetical protein [Actinoplanes octamycinicus]GIE60824.1 hypothetical protein Aoc01nite_62260 [Actinoplanes octamycinicus]